MTKRFHLFATVHKGLRNALNTLVWTAGKMDVDDEERRGAFFAEFKDVAAMLHQHAKDEDTHIDPLIERCAPEVSRALEEQHRRSEEQLSALERSAAELERSFDAEAWLSFVDEFNRFVGDYYLHLYHEEAIAMPRLWASYDDAALLATSMKLRSGIPAHIQSNFQKYMIPAASIQEQTMMLSGAKSSVPEPVFQGICALYESLLPADEWKKLQERVMVGR
ncbi:hemerythrin domain-containing protein [Paenibacillus sp.]|uniref:hemerythrin domain-containing protein n=1 Tax=Paenibacillus sp. TaxID=58172 RepID=UPI002D231B0B|nr:hemerythrin domain-containing protein [Paenibacillus sp.]HZG84351.1 hemerythrin domain-containing protein [Paenibacillus sp.]